MIGAALGSLGLSVTANYIFEKLKNLAGDEFESYYSLLPLPAETFQQIDSSLVGFLKLKKSEYGKKQMRATERVFDRMLTDKSKIERTTFLELVLFDSENAKGKIEKFLLDSAEGNERTTATVDGKLATTLAYEIVDSANEHFNRKIKGLKRLADHLETSQETAKIVRDYTRRKETENRKAVTDEELLQYQEYLRDEYSKTSLNGFDAFFKNDSLEADLEKSFVSLNLESLGGEIESAVPSENAILSHQYNILRGQAGCGKTTLLQWICLVSAEAQERSPLIPFLVPMREIFSKGSGTFSIDLSYELACRDVDLREALGRDWMMKALGSGHAIVMLDGLDEVPFERRRDFWKFVRRISKRYPTARILITSRNLSHTHNSSGLYKDPLELSDPEFVKSKHEWDPPAGFLDFRVKGLSKEDISLFVDKWHAGIDIAKLPSGIGSAVDEIASQLKIKLLDSAEDESLAELSSTPMLCALLCMVNLLEGGKLPVTPRSLYKAALEILIRTRDELRGVPLEKKYEEITLRQRQRILEYIAFFMQDAAFKDGNYLVEAKKADVSSIIKLYQERPDGEPISDFQSSDILEFLINRTAVIREPTTGFVDFSHRSFMEYLAAEHFVRNIPKMQISQYCQLDQWHGTLRFLTNSEAGGVAYNGIVLDQLDQYIDRARLGSDKSYRDFSSSMIEHLHEVPIGDRDLLISVITKLRPFSRESARFLRFVPFSTISSIFDISSGKSSNECLELAYVYLYHTSKKSADLVRSDFARLEDRQFMIDLNASRRLKLSEQTALLGKLIAASGTDVKKKGWHRVYCDDVGLLESKLFDTEMKTSSKIIIDELVLDAKSKIPHSASLFDLVSEIKVDTFSEERALDIVKRVLSSQRCSTAIIVSNAVFEAVRELSPRIRSD